MANYLIDSMTWSHSRLSCYESCPYKFYLKYIEDLCPEPCFLSSYGSFMHELLAAFYRGELSPRQAVDRYLRHFRQEVTGRPPSQKVFDSYFSDGLLALQNLKPFPGSVLDVERRFSFSVAGLPFVGIVDLLAEDETGICVVDHKSKKFRPPSSRGNRELDAYLRQLYLYAVPVVEKYGRAPSSLVLNCFRAAPVAVTFNAEKFLSAQMWAVDTISKIERETKWPARPEYFQCNFLCGLKEECVYAQFA